MNRFAQCYFEATRGYVIEETHARGASHYVGNKYEILVNEKWYEHQTESVFETDKM